MSAPPRPRHAVVFVHAHPDDEALLTAGTMARAAAEGHRVVLVVATDGAAGLASAEFRLTWPPPGRPSSQESAPGPRRRAHRHAWATPTPGSTARSPAGSRTASAFDVARRIAADLRRGGRRRPRRLRPLGRLRPSGPPAGAPVRCARRSVLCAGRPRLFEATLPREPIARAVHLAAATGLTPAELLTRGVRRRLDARGADHPSGQRARATWRPRSASLRAHASQATADGTVRTLAVLTRLPRPCRALLLGTEYYVLVSDPQTASDLVDGRRGCRRRSR